MEQFLTNPYIYWIVTGAFGLLASALIYLVKHQRTKDEKRYEQMEKRIENEHERVTTIISQLPVNYTLRDEFLRVTTAQNSKLDNLTDLLREQTAAIASLEATIKSKEGGK